MFFWKGSHDHQVVQTKGFAVAAKKALIHDNELLAAFSELCRGQADDLGGGVWKKRLNANRHRSIVLARGRRYWVFQFLFAKQDQSNLSHQELQAFRALAKAYEGLDGWQVQQLLEMKAFVEIRHEQAIQD
ncbi:Putative cytoplasmic protein [Pseudomonas chlororaphis subsp. aurantiaca]|nr:type II toxin-antitoxin system RelE/ParE family toxin [Pseudomonas chlororaphis]AZD38560.1 Putative cytoplasmic protein [Pseudomonas chlororaphis subsp. aurantiaca]AZD44901.1 Putative cytoplasmic protein [Pseudomonas chlororaphis subsp. aurantiaca]